MAKRSDFAQKLLDDLRLRKERMGMATSGHHSAQAPSTGYAYGNSRWAFRGSGEATSSRSSNKNIPSTEVTKMWLSTRHHRAPSFEGASQDIVPVGRTRSKEQSIDVSMALALALSNTGKLQNIELFSNTTVGKKHILHRGSLNFREMDGNILRTSNQFPFLSPLQIEEISKGVQQLNMILRACSNGVIFSRDSIDIGRELLKGAIDLEESLRMLVSLQDASDYMAGSQGKQIKLLKGKEDESSSEEVNDRKLMKPRFSFDKASKQSRQHVREDGNTDLVEHKQMALSYPQKLKNANSNPNKSSSTASLQFNYHRRSMSSGPGSILDAQFLEHAKEISHSKELRSFSKDGNCSSSTNNKQYSSKGGSACEKVRIPNVVAKLMGLEELPLIMPEMKKIEVQNVPNPKQVKGSIKMKTDAEISKKEADQMTHSAPKMKGQNIVIEEKGIAEIKAVNNLELVHSKVKKKMKETTSSEHHNPAFSEEVQFSITKEMDMASMDCCKEVKVAKTEAAKEGERVSRMQTYNTKVEQGATRKPTPEQGTQTTAQVLHRNSDDTIIKHEKAQRNKDVVPTQQRNAQKVNPTVPQQQSTIHRLKTKHTVHKQAEKIVHDKRNKPQTVIENKKEVKLKNAEVSPSDMKTQKVSSSTATTTTTRSLIKFSDEVQPKEYAKGNHTEQNKLQNRIFINREADRKSENEISEEKRPLTTVVKTEKQKVMPLIPAQTIRKSMPNPSALKVEAAKLIQGRNKSRGILVEENRRIKTAGAKEKNLKPKTSFLHELEHRWKERTGKVEAMDSSHEMKSEHHSQQTTAPTNPLCSSDVSEIPRLTDQIIREETNVEAQEEEAANPTSCCDNTDTDSVVLQSPRISVKEEVQLEPLLEENKQEGPAKISQLGNCHSLAQQNIATTEVYDQELLTKDEDTLKQILMNSQQFLNTAQALFKIKIPIGVLQASENLCQCEGDKLVLDTAYELMRRKGKREEAPFSKKVSFAPAKVTCLDDLIKELNNDLRNLEISSKSEGANTDIAEHLHMMIARDIQNENPDANFMWDVCWNRMTFASIEKEEIVRDVEKHVLNGLINDLARDLISVCISI